MTFPMEKQALGDGQEEYEVGDWDRHVFTVDAMPEIDN